MFNILENLLVMVQMKRMVEIYIRLAELETTKEVELIPTSS